MVSMIYGYLISNDNNTLKVNNIPDQLTDNQYCWFHFNGENPQTKKWLEAYTTIPPIGIDMLLSKNTRPNVTTFGDSILLTLRAVNFTDKSTKNPFNALNIWISPSYIITVRNVKVLAMDEIASNLELGIPIQTKEDFIIELINNLSKQIYSMIREIEDLSNDIDEQINLNNYNGVESKAIDLRKDIARIKKILMPQRDALLVLSSDNLPFFSATNRKTLQYLYNKTVKYVEDIEMIKEHIVLNQEEIKTHKNDLMNLSMHRLSIISGLFLPLGFITGLLGVNIGGLPGINNPYAFNFLTAVSILYLIITFIFLYSNKKM